MRLASIEIVENVNIGKQINKLFQQFHAIKTQSQMNKWKLKVKTFRAGTYKNKSILDILKSGNLLVKKSFLASEFIKVIKKTV